LPPEKRFLCTIEGELAAEDIDWHESSYYPSPRESAEPSLRG